MYGLKDNEHMYVMTLCERIRKYKLSTAIIVLTGKGQDGRNTVICAGRLLRFDLNTCRVQGRYIVYSHITIY